MRILSEKPCQRRYHRVNAPLYVQFDEAAYLATDWSTGGLRVEGIRNKTPLPGMEINLVLSLPFQGFSISFDVRLFVVRCNQDGMFAGYFTQLGEREKSLIMHFIDELVRGSMTSIEDTILRIDVPVTLVSTEPDPNPNVELPLRRRTLKSLCISMLYLCLGSILLWYFYFLIYTSYLHLKVETAVINAPLEVVSASFDGRVLHVASKEGDVLKSGQEVMLLTAFDLERDIDLAKIKTREADDKIQLLSKKLEIELGQVENYALVQKNDLKAARFRHTANKRLLSLATAGYVRHETLFNEGWITVEKLEDKAVNLEDTRLEYERSRLALKQLRALGKSTNSEKYFDGDEFQGLAAELKVELEHAVALLETSHATLLSLEKHRHRIAVVAPFPGRLHTLIKTQGSAVNRGDVLAIFENSTQRNVLAFLTQKDVLEISLGRLASVYVPAVDSTFKARVTRIDRTHGFVDEMAQRYSWRGTQDRSAIVELSLLPGPYMQTLDLVAGLPATVLFEKHSWWNSAL